MTDAFIGQIQVFPYNFRPVRGWAHLRRQASYR